MSKSSRRSSSPLHHAYTLAPLQSGHPNTDVAQPPKWHAWHHNDFHQSRLCLHFSCFHLFFYSFGDNFSLFLEVSQLMLALLNIALYWQCVLRFFCLLLHNRMKEKVLYSLTANPVYWLPIGMHTVSFDSQVLLKSIPWTHDLTLAGLLEVQHAWLCTNGSLPGLTIDGTKSLCQAIIICSVWSSMCQGPSVPKVD